MFHIVDTPPCGRQLVPYLFPVSFYRMAEKQVLQNRNHNDKKHQPHVKYYHHGQAYHEQHRLHQHIIERTHHALDAFVVASRCPACFFMHIQYFRIFQILIVHGKRFCHTLRNHLHTDIDKIMTPSVVAKGIHPPDYYVNRQKYHNQLYQGHNIFFFASRLQHHQINHVLSGESTEHLYKGIHCHAEYNKQNQYRLVFFYILKAIPNIAENPKLFV